MTIPYRVPVLESYEFQPAVLDKDLSTPPGSPAKGNRYIVGRRGHREIGQAKKKTSLGMMVLFGNLMHPKLAHLPMLLMKINFINTMEVLGLFFLKNWV